MRITVPANRLIGALEALKPIARNPSKEEKELHGYQPLIFATTTRDTGGQQLLTLTETNRTTTALALIPVVASYGALEDFAFNFKRIPAIVKVLESEDVKDTVDIELGEGFEGTVSFTLISEAGANAEVRTAVEEWQEWPYRQILKEFNSRELRPEPLSAGLGIADIAKLKKAESLYGSPITMSEANRIYLNFSGHIIVLLKQGAEPTENEIRNRKQIIESSQVMIDTIAEGIIGTDPIV